MGEERDSTFKQMSLEDEGSVGPRGLLFFGHSREEATRVTTLLNEIERYPVPIACVTKTMGEWTIERALEGDDAGSLLPVGQVPRIILVSGLPNRIIHQLLDRFAETELPRPIFAVATPANLQFTVLQLMSDLIAEHQSAQGS